jgi:hypothetical protein
VRELFTEFLDQHEKLHDVLHLSMGGISMIRSRHQAMTLLAELDGKLEEEAEKLKRAERDRDLAQRELDNDFPLLHEQATVALWSSLEALIRTFLGRWLENKPEAWQTDAVRRLKVRLGEYESLDRADRCLWIVDLLDQEIGGPLRNGANRFECLLQPFGLSGEIDDEVQKALFELSQVRHVLVHRRGYADKRLLNACPWLSYKGGEPIKIGHAMWRRYDGAVGEYIFEIIRRVALSFGVLPPERPGS